MSANCLTVVLHELRALIGSVVSNILGGGGPQV